MSRNEQKQKTRQRIVDAAGRGFRKGGFGGIGVDGLAKEAGVTSGGFYVHFDSKTDAFREAVAQGMKDLKIGVLHFQTEHGRNWWPEFVRFYLGYKRNCDLSDSCTLQSLSPEVARSDAVAQTTFETGLLDVAQAVVDGPSSPKVPRSLASALAALASLVGAVTLARAVNSTEVGNQIAASTELVLLGAKAKPPSATPTNSEDE
ncbi:MAG: TetR/AcrR family transcriptional regulator [Glaciimonas sp.]|nr:TetR/AcrR family transcriptional regulator [Glaciimonas sp.]